MPQFAHTPAELTGSQAFVGIDGRGADGGQCLVMRDEATDRVERHLGSCCSVRLRHRQYMLTMGVPRRIV